MARADTTHRNTHRLPALLMLAALVAAATAQDRPPERFPLRKPSSQAAVERFRELAPHDRLQRATKAGGARPFVPVTQGELDLSVVERGTVESAEVSDVVCRVKGKGNATTIKWIVEDGTMVKKGQRLVELDDAELRDRLHAREVALDRAAAARLLAETNLKLLAKERRLDERAADVSLRIARLELKDYAGKEPARKELLQLKVEQAEVALEAVKLRGQAKQALAEADVKAAALAEKLAARQKDDMAAEVAECVLTAPQDGVAAFYVPEVGRFGAAGPVVAQGELVREGQKIMRVCGLDRFNVGTRVHEALVTRLRAGQSATVRIDAFPGRALRGQIKEVATKALQGAWLTGDVKVYPVVVELIDQVRGLKPGMSAEVHVEGGRRPKALQVPAEAVIQVGGNAYCYVRGATASRSGR